MHPIIYSSPPQSHKVLQLRCDGGCNCFLRPENLQTVQCNKLLLPDHKLQKEAHKRLVVVVVRRLWFHWISRDDVFSVRIQDMDLILIRPVWHRVC